MATTLAQIEEKKSVGKAITEEEGPLVLKFEPRLDIIENRRRQLFQLERQAIDTMQISERKKQRLLRNLHKDIYNGRFEQTLITTSIFEDDIND